jgi:hypothetical protein
MAETDSNVLDYNRPFTVELSFRGADGITRTVVKETYPLKAMVKNMEQRGVRAPWDSEVR